SSFLLELSRQAPGSLAAANSRARWDKNRLILLLAAPEKVERSVNAPDRGDTERDIGLFVTHPSDRKRPNQIEEHTEQIGHQPKHGNHHVLETVEAMMFSERDNRDDAGHHVEQERAEVAG